MNKSKLTHEDLQDLAEYCFNDATFWIGLVENKGEKLTIKQFCIELAKHMSYHRNRDIIEGIE